jgi:hypothetical protein
MDKTIGFMLLKQPPENVIKQVQNRLQNLIALLECTSNIQSSKVDTRPNAGYSSLHLASSFWVSVTPISPIG